MDRFRENIISVNFAPKDALFNPFRTQLRPFFLLIEPYLHALLTKRHHRRKDRAKFIGLSGRAEGLIRTNNGMTFPKKLSTEHIGHRKKEKQVFAFH